MHPSLDRRNQRIYAGIWIAFAVAIGLYVIASAFLHLPRVAALLLALIPGIAVVLLPFKIRLSGFSVRGRFLLENGDAVTRTIPAYLPSNVSDEETIAAVKAMLEKLHTDGHQFPEGHGRLIELLNQPGTSQKRLIVRGDFQMSSGELATRTVSCRLPTKIDSMNYREIRDRLVHDLRTEGHLFPDGLGHLTDVHDAMFL